ncbi:MAG: ATP-dependent helicase Lhr and Lhr-like helicase [Acidobacteriota bacterium]|nr:ATP-dependent helicase Lhr and Lhr-like helicase [Acidobacteriota bacterium]
MSHIDSLKSLHPGLQKIIYEKGWKKGLSEIQLKAIQVILEGHDCIIEAPTAGGKTEAVFFPALTKVAAKKKNSVQILYLAPLRALLNNIEKRVIEYSIACGLHCFKWHGDVDQKGKINEIKNPSQVLLTTPESLEAILLRKAGWEKFFSDLEIVIIDEAHNFAFSDRGGHLITLLERLEKTLDIHFQRIALTATVGNPGELLQWFAGSNRGPGKRVYSTSGSKKEKDFLVQFFDKTLDKDTTPEYMSHIRQFKTLYKLLPNKKTIIFGKSRKHTEELAAAVLKMNEISRSKNPVRVRTHHSSVSKYYREEAEKLIQIASESGLQAIISTSTLELGIDIGELDQIIQIGILTSSSAFLQRVGRTGRREGKKQFFRGLCNDRKDLVLLTAVINLGLKGISESLKLSKKSYHLLAHQLICLSLQKNGIGIDEAWDILSGAYCFSGISKYKFCELTQAMIRQEYLRDVDSVMVIGEVGEKNFLGANWQRLFATFDSASMYDVVEGKNQVGTLDSAFVEALSVPFLFVLGGILWEAEKVDVKTMQVFSRKTNYGDAPRWITFGGGDVPLETAKEAGRILFGEGFLKFLDEEGRTGIEAERNEHIGIHWDDSKWVVNVSDSGIAQIWTFAGDKINRTLALLVRSEGIGQAVSSYKNVEIESDIDNRDILSERIFALLERVKKMDLSQLEILEEKISKLLRRSAFSKFTKCLPDNLWLEAMAERTLDIKSLINELLDKKMEDSNLG